MQINMIVNGRQIIDKVEPDTLLLDFLRKHGCYSVKRGCDTANCGLCTVLDGENPILSCSTLAIRMNGKSITTIEGLQKDASIFAEFMGKEGTDQCGFCSPGFVITVLSMEKEFAQNNIVEPSIEQINEYLSGNLCRCTGYMGHLRAITQYLKRDKKAGEENEPK